MSYEFTASHFDTCLPCYLLSHGNGDSELLLSAEVDGSTTYMDLEQALFEDLNASTCEKEGFSYDGARGALTEMFSEVEDMGALFDSSLDESCDDCGDSCYAWILVQWEEN